MLEIKLKKKKKTAETKDAFDENHQQTRHGERTDELEYMSTEMSQTEEEREKKN